MTEVAKEFEKKHLKGHWVKRRYHTNGQTDRFT
jgi:hypothetical protein